MPKSTRMTRSGLGLCPVLSARVYGKGGSPRANATARAEGQTRTIDMRAPSLGRFAVSYSKPPAFDLTEHATKARAIRNLGHAVGDHRDRCPCPDHHCRRLVRDSMSYCAIVQTWLTMGASRKGKERRFAGVSSGCCCNGKRGKRLTSAGLR